jgi:predicted TIM-barrel fold metal-dependent hydrolase
MLIKRIAGFDAWASVGQKGMERAFPEGIETEFRRLHFECAQAWSKTNISALRSLVPDSQILYGSDYPFFPLPHGTARFRGLKLPPKAMEAISVGNARRLLPRWA